MFCPHCGSSIPDESGFCPFCGDPLRKGAHPGQEYGGDSAGRPPTPPPPPPPPRDQGIRGWVIGVIVAVCIVLAGGAVTAVLLLRSGGDDRSSSASSTTTKLATATTGLPTTTTAPATITSTTVLPGNGSSTTSDTNQADRSWSIDRWELLLDVQPNSDVQVEETVTFSFKGSFTWITRTMGEFGSSAITGLEVWQDGRQLPQGKDAGSWETYLDGNTELIKFHTDVTDASKAWTVKYVAKEIVVPNTVDDIDELMWYVFDDVMPVAVSDVSVTVRLPGNIPAENLATAVQTGDAVQYEIDSPFPSTVVYTAAEVPANTAFSIYAGIPKGVVELPSR